MSNNQIAALVERIERLEEEKRGIAEDIKDVYAEAKDNGFDTKALRAVIARRRKDQEELAILEARMEEYQAALGALADTPLGQAMAPGMRA